MPSAFGWFLDVFVAVSSLHNFINGVNCSCNQLHMIGNDRISRERDRKRARLNWIFIDTKHFWLLSCNTVAIEMILSFAVERITFNYLKLIEASLYLVFVCVQFKSGLNPKRMQTKRSDWIYPFSEWALRIPWNVDTAQNHVAASDAFSSNTSIHIGSSNCVWTWLSFIFICVAAARIKWL